MTGNAKAVSYGSNEALYITGESVNKKHPELIDFVGNNLMSDHLNASGVWEEMKLTYAKFRDRYPRMQNLVIACEISPAKEHTVNFTLQDWDDLWMEVVAEMDKIEMWKESENEGEEPVLVSPKTNIAGSKYSTYLHRDSDSGIPHLHIAVCRIDNNGNENNDHFIGKRIQQATEIVARRRGWKTAASIHADALPIVTNDCMEVLRSMHKFSLEEYFKRIEQKGYEVHARKDKEGKFCAYSLVAHNCNYKASELGKARNLTVTRIAETWRKLHEEQRADHDKRKLTPVETPKARPVVRPKPEAQAEVVRPKPTTPAIRPASTFGNFNVWSEGMACYTFNDGGNRTCFIPKVAYDYFEKEFDWSEIGNWRELSDMAVELFIGYLDAATSMAPSGGGGGGQSEMPWGRKDDEDDLAWARRCANFAKKSVGIKPKGRTR